MHPTSEKSPLPIAHEILNAGSVRSATFEENLEGKPLVGFRLAGRRELPGCVGRRLVADVVEVRG